MIIPLAGHRRPLATTGSPPRWAVSTLAWASVAALSACGSGGSGSNPAAPPPTRLVGTAAVGAPMAGATITVSDADTTTVDVTTTAAADGSYSVDVSDLGPPLLVRASGMLNGEAVSHMAVLASV